MRLTPDPECLPNFRLKIGANVIVEILKPAPNWPNKTPCARILKMPEYEDYP